VQTSTEQCPGHITPEQYRTDGTPVLNVLALALGLEGPDEGIAAAEIGARGLPKLFGWVGKLFGRGGGAAGKTGEEVVETTGQLHHVISTKIGRELERNPNLAGEYTQRDPRFVTRGVDEAAHRGYQTWHREVDTEVTGWLRANRNATPEEFELYLRNRYGQPDLRHRFPNGF
jgi:hypothetical protein